MAKKYIQNMKNKAKSSKLEKATERIIENIAEDIKKEYKKKLEGYNKNLPKSIRDKYVIIGTLPKIERSRIKDWTPEDEERRKKLIRILSPIPKPKSFLDFAFNYDISNPFLADTIKKALKKAKKKVKEIFLPCVFASVVAMTSMKSANADGVAISKGITLGLGADVEYNFKSPLLYDALNQDFRNWIPSWRSIDAGSSLIMPEIKASLEFDLGGLKITPSLSNKFCNGDIKYNEDYNIFTEGKYAPARFTRIERFDIRSPTIGVRVGTDIMKDTSIYFGSGLELTSVTGDVDSTMKRLDNRYTQWKKADYSGSGIVSSIEAGLEHKIFDNFSAGFSLGRKFGNINAAGKERTTQNMDTKVTESDYSQPFDFNNSYLKFKLGLRF